MKKKLLYGVSGLVLLISFIYILILNITRLNTYILFLSPLLIITILLITRLIYNIHDDKLVRKLCLIFQVCNLIFLIYLGFKLAVNKAWDYGQIQATAVSYAEKGKFIDLDYYIRCPNNQFLVICLSLFYKIINALTGTHLTEFYIYCSNVVNALFISFSTFLCYLLARKEKGEKFACVLVLMIAICLPIAVYTPILYSDTLGLMFIPLPLLLYSYYKDNHKIRYLIGISITSVIAFLIKPSLIFVLLAIAISMFINETWKKFIPKLLCMIIVFSIFLVGMNKLMDYGLGITSDDYDRYKFPYTHHVMMALNTTGGYNEADVQFSKSFNTYAEKQNANLKVIEERIKNRGFLGTTKHLLYTKMVKTWTDSTFGSNDYLARKPIKKGFWYSLVTKDGINYHFYEAYTGSYWCFIIIGVIIACLKGLKGDSDIMNMAKIVILLLMLFLIIWECNPRYVVQILPLIIMVSMSGWKGLIDSNLKIGE